MRMDQAGLLKNVKMLEWSQYLLSGKIWPQYTLVVANCRADIVLYAITIKYHSYIPPVQFYISTRIGIGIGLKKNKTFRIFTINQ